MAMHRNAFDTMFPVVEILRPIPPVAWIPVSIIFWPTRELSVVFIVFLGAFWIVLLNTIGGASNIEPNYKRAAMSLGSTPRDMFWRIILPATVPSIITGMAVGMGIAWEMVVAAEMVAGRTGLGYLLWQSFEVNAIAQCIVCMISIGIAGYLSSEIIRRVRELCRPVAAATLTFRVVSDDAGRSIATDHDARRRRVPVRRCCGNLPSNRCRLSR